MVSEKIKIRNRLGLEQHPAGVFCRTATRFPCRIQIQKEDRIANAKSVISVLAACILPGDEILLYCDGPEEEKALQTLKEQVAQGLEDDVIISE